MYKLLSLFVMILLSFNVTPVKAKDVTGEVVKLWPSAPPGYGQPSGPEKIGREGAATGSYSNISEPRMEIYRPAKPNGAAVLIIGGGGYFRIQIGSAAKPLASVLLARNITPIILYYRLPGDGWNADAPFQDGQRAMRLIRANAQKWGIDPDKLGVVGFSAGGHLAGTLATKYNHLFYPSVDENDVFSAKPVFTGMIYPVVSLEPPLNTTQTAKKLAPLGDPASWSIDQNVDETTPPVFLAHATDDPIANPDHSIRMYQAMRTHGRDVELHIFEKGGHSWGIGKPGSAVEIWPRLFLSWGEQHGWF